MVFVHDNPQFARQICHIIAPCQIKLWLRGFVRLNQNKISIIKSEAMEKSQGHVGIIENDFRKEAVSAWVGVRQDHYLLGSDGF